MFTKARDKIRLYKLDRDMYRRRAEDLHWQTVKTFSVIEQIPSLLRSLDYKYSNANLQWAERKCPDIWGSVYAASLNGGEDPAVVADKAVREYMKRVRRVT